MKRVIHLICNAHIDPVWLWKWEEGAAEAISTFRTAARLCEENDDFIFCHNEALLYEWVLEYEPDLFERIKKLVKQGKWVIMGGFYLQPDCNIPSGEAMIRQIEVGNDFFMKHFSVKCHTAMNFDSFGHSRGLVQILKYMGYDNYVCCRPTHNNKTNEFPNEFTWVGYDDSIVNVRRHYELYNSALGHALDKIKYNIENINENPLMILWGVGNHGGGPSEKDINDINRYKDEVKNELSIYHSTLDRYFESNKDAFSKHRVAKSLWAVNTGCYTSMSLVKQKYRQLEKELFLTEKIASQASIFTNMEYPEDIKDAEKDLLFSQFHDILPGTVIKSAESDAIRRLDHGLEILSRIKTRAFFKLSNNIKYEANGNYPIFVYNPLPYKVKKIVEVEFQLKDQNWEDNFTFMHVYDRYGNLLDSQVEKEECNLNLDWRKHITFYAELDPMSINFFECRPYKVKTLSSYPIYEGVKEFNCGELKVLFNFDNGRIVSIKKNGFEYLKDALRLSVYSDSEDPWAMNQDTKLGDFIGEFVLADKKTGTLLSGVENVIPSSRIIEDGDVRTVIECVYTYNTSNAFIKYYFNKNESMIDLEYKVLFNERSKCLKLEIPSVIDDKFIGREMFGSEELSKTGQEVVFHDYVGLFNDNDGLFMINNGTYGGAYINHSLCLSLLRTPAYSGHPIDNRPVLKQNRYTDRIDIGYREFKFRLGVGDKNTAESKAYENENSLFALSFFPHGGFGKKGDSLIELSNNKVELVSLRIKDNKLLVTLYNGGNDTQETNIFISKLNINKQVKLTKYQFIKFEFNIGE